jgi:hypothetical protein
LFALCWAAPNKQAWPPLLNYAPRLPIGYDIASTGPPVPRQRVRAQDTDVRRRYRYSSFTLALWRLDVARCERVTVTRERIEFLGERRRSLDQRQATFRRLDKAMGHADVRDETLVDA